MVAKTPCATPSRAEALSPPPGGLREQGIAAEAVAEPDRQPPIAPAAEEPAAEEPSGPAALTLPGLLQLFGEAVRGLRSFSIREALEAVRRLPPSQQQTALAQDLVARCNFELAEYGRAAELYGLCCKAHRKNRLIGLEYYSTALWHLKEHAALGALAQTALEWGRLRPQTWCAVGNCLSLQQDREGALRCFKRAIQLDPGFAYAHTLSGHELAAGEKYHEAIQMYERAISVDRRHYNAWWGLGSVFYRQEEYVNARYHFEQAVSINAGNAVLRTSLGMALQALQEPERALSVFAGAENSHHCNALASFQKGCALLSLGRHAEAIETLQRAQRLAPKEPCVYFQLGRAHVASHDAKNALLHFTRALDLCGAKDSKDHQMIVAAQMELTRCSAQEEDTSLHGSLADRTPRRIGGSCASELRAAECTPLPAEELWAPDRRRWAD